MKNKLVTIVLSLIITFLASQSVFATKDFFTFELGSSLSGNSNLLSASQIGYLKTKENNFLHIFWGSLIDVHMERTSYIFSEIGYEKKLLNHPCYLNFSLGIGKVNLTSDFLSTNNMFTERISLGYKNYYLSFRHMSNGGKLFGNRGENLGRNTITIGIRF